MSTLAEPVPERLTADTVNARWATGGGRAAVLEPRLVRQYEASLRATARRCVAAYRARTQVLTAAMPPKPEGDPTNISQPPQPTVDQVLNAELAAASAEARTQTTRRRMAEAVAGEILGSFEPDEGTRALLEPLVRRQAGVQAERLVAGSRDAVANVILDALVEGWSVDTTADYMLKVLNEQARWRAVMLARTDLIALGNGAAEQSVLVLGDAGPQYRTWVTAGDERVRETHVDANGQTVQVGQPFNVGDALLQYPGDPHGPDSEVIQCRCVQVYSDSPQPVLRHTFAGGIDDRVAVLASALSADELEALVAAFDPAKHPHRPAGDSRGGEWAPKEAVSGVDDDYAELGVDDATIIAGVRKALEERPERLTHGYTGTNSFFIVGDKVYAFNDWRDIPVEDRGRAINIHSHAPDGIVNAGQMDESFPLSGLASDRQPINSGDLHVFHESFRKGQAGPRMGLLHGDGTMEILGYTNDSNPAALNRKSEKTIRKQVFGEGQIELKPEKLREWAAKNGMDYRDPVVFATHEEVAAIRNRHPNPSLHDK